jgi:hypothetical protein
MKKIFYLLFFCFLLNGKRTHAQQCGSYNITVPGTFSASSTSIPCASSADIRAFVYFDKAALDANEYVRTVNFSGPGAVALPPGWTYVGLDYIGIDKTSGFSEYKYALILRPASATTPGGQATVRNSHFCQASNAWFYSPAKTFTITRSTSPGSITATAAGPATICPGKAATYTLQNVPSWVTSVRWTANSNLAPQSGTGSTASVTVSASANGTATVTFTISGTCGSYNITANTAVLTPAYPVANNSTFSSLVVRKQLFEG